jgi:hypothetical protein
MNAVTAIAASLYICASNPMNIMEYGDISYNPLIIRDRRAWENTDYKNLCARTSANLLHAGRRIGSPGVSGVANNAI